MNKIYLLSVYPEGYKSLTIPQDEDYADYDCLLWDGKPKLDTWKTPNLIWLEDDLTNADDKIADFTAFQGGPIAVSEQAFALLKDLFGNQVEYLPTEGPSSSSWRLLNIINVIDIMDASKSRYKVYSSGKVGACIHAYLNEPGTNNRIFHVKGFLPRMFIDEQSKNAIESSDLTGVLIREYLNP